MIFSLKHAICNIRKNFNALCLWILNMRVHCDNEHNKKYAIHALAWMVLPIYENSSQGVEWRWVKTFMVLNYWYIEFVVTENEWDVLDREWPRRMCKHTFILKSMSMCKVCKLASDASEGTWWCETNNKVSESQKKKAWSIYHAEYLENYFRHANLCK